MATPAKGTTAKARAPLPGGSRAEGKKPLDEEMLMPPSVESSDDEDERDDRKELETLRQLTNSQQTVIQEQTQKIANQQHAINTQEARMDEQAARITQQKLDSVHQQNQLAQLEERLVMLLDNQGIGSDPTSTVIIQNPGGKGKFTVERYGGERDMARPFLTNMAMYFDHYQITAHMDRIRATSMHLKDEAARWMQPIMDDYLENPTRMREDVAQILSSWGTYRREFLKMFGEQDEEERTLQKLEKLRQDKSVSAYITKFKQLQSRLDWGDSPLQRAYYKGLKEAVKDGLMYMDKPEDLTELMEQSIKVDNRVYERLTQKKTIPVANTGKARRETKRDHEGDVLMTGNVKNKNWKKGQRLSKEERQRRFDNKACLLCGEEGHFKDKCPKKDKSTSDKATIRMIRDQIPDAALAEGTDEDVSDLDLYEKARRRVPNELTEEPMMVRKVPGYKPRIPENNNHEAQKAFGHFPTKEAPWKGQTTGWKVHLQEAKDCGQDNCLDHREPDGAKGIKEKLRNHGTKHWTACYNDHCLIHLSGKENGYYPRREVPKQLEEDAWHADLSGWACKIPECRHHSGKQGVRDTRSSKARQLDQRIKLATEDEEITALREQRAQSHRGIQWHRCYNPICRDHFEAKIENGLFPTRPPKGLNKRSKN